MEISSQTVPGKPLLKTVCLVFLKATSHSFPTHSKGNFVDTSNTDLTLWKQSKVIERGSEHCYLCLKKHPRAEREVSLITLPSGCGCMGHLICWSVWKTLILRCESDILYPKIASLVQSLDSSDSQKSKPPADPFSGNTVFIISQGNFQPVWPLGKMGIAPSAVVEPMVEPWSHSWEQIPRDSPIQGHTHRYTWMSGQFQ